MKKSKAGWYIRKSNIYKFLLQYALYKEFEHSIEPAISVLKSYKSKYKLLQIYKMVFELLSNKVSREKIKDHIYPQKSSEATEIRLFAIDYIKSCRNHFIFCDVPYVNYIYENMVKIVY